MKQAVVAFKAKEEFIQAIDKAAALENRTRSGLIKHAIIEYLAPRADIEAGKTQVDVAALRGEEK